MADTYIDGNWTRPDTNGAPRNSYPFLKNGDRAAIIIEQDFWQEKARFTPADLVVAHPDFRDAYRMAETEPVETLAGLCSFTQTYARIPGDQVTYGTRVITKPDPSSFGTLIAFYKSSPFAVGTGGNVYIYSGYYFGGNQIFGPAKTPYTSANSGGNTRITYVGHGVTGTETLGIVNAALGPTLLIVFSPAQYTVVDADHIDLLGVNYGTSPGAIAVYLRDYTPGTDRVGMRNTQKFYLPGVTAGITTPADIPLPSLLLNDNDFIAALISGATGYIAYDASELTRWNDWPIYTQTFYELNLATV